MASATLTDLSHRAEALQAYPLFFEPASIRFLAQRHRAVEELQRERPGVIDEIKFIRDVAGHRVGVGLHQVLGDVFHDGLVDELEIADILAFRETMDDARKDLLSGARRKLSERIGDESDIDKIMEIGRRYCIDELEPALREFRIVAQDSKIKLFGNLSVRAAESFKYGTRGSGASGLVASVVPGCTLWSFALAGAAIGALGALPGVVRDVVDSYHDNKKRTRTGISYVNSILRRGR